MILPDPDFNRLKTTLYRGKADRVPFAEITIDEGAKERFLGKNVNSFETDAEFYLKAGYDFITLGRRIAGFPPIWSSANYTNYYDVQRQVGKGKSQGVIQSWQDFKNYPWPKPGDLDFRILDKANKKLASGMKVIRYMGPVFQMVWMLMGFDAFCYGLADDSGLIEAMMDKIFEIVHYELEDALQRDIVGAVWYGDDIAIKDRLMVSPEFLRAYFFPKLKMLGQACASRNIPFIYHTDGNIIDIVDDIIDSGVVALHPIDPTGMDIFDFYEKFNDKLAIIGNVDVSLLVQGSKKQVIHETKYLIERLWPRGGYILGSSNSIPRTVNIDNYRAMLETARQYGDYKDQR